LKKQGKRLMRKKLAGFGFIMFDALFAILVIIFMLYLYVAISNAIIQKAIFERKHTSSLFKTILLSEKLVKIDIAKKEGPLLQSNTIEISSDLLQKLEEAAESYREEFKANYISLIISTNGDIIANVTEGDSGVEQIYCVRRIVLLSTGPQSDIGSFDVCLGWYDVP
jgi:hypothetical protein